MNTCVWPTLLLAAPLLCLSACDPCSGTLGCGLPRVRYEGQLNNRFRPGPGAGIEVEFIQTGGVPLQASPIKAISDASGRFELDGEARGEGDVVGDLLIQPGAPFQPLRVPDVVLHSTRAEGEVRYLGAWTVPHPFLRYLGEVYYRDSNRPATRIRVEFRRTGGVAAKPDTFSMVTDSITGRFSLSPEISEAGVLIGELLVTPLPPLKPFVIPGVQLPALTEDTPTTLIGRWGIGPHLPYAGLLVWEDTRLPASGVEVEFRRTGGIPVNPDRFTTRSNEFGTFPLAPEPLMNGEVVGELVIRPPAPYATITVPDLRLSTSDLDEATQLIGQWLIPRQ